MIKREDRALVDQVLRELGKTVNELYKHEEKREQYLTIGELRKIIYLTVKRTRDDRIIRDKGQKHPDKSRN